MIYYKRKINFPALLNISVSMFINALSAFSKLKMFTFEFFSFYCFLFLFWFVCFSFEVMILLGYVFGLDFFFGKYPGVQLL